MKFLYALIFTTLLLNVSQAQVLEQDSLALVSLYDNLNGENWFEQWDFAVPVSTWEKVTVEGNRVVRLNMRYNGMSGSIPAEIADLTELNSLTLTYNDIANPTSEYLAQLPKLRYYQCSNNESPFSFEAAFCEGNTLEELYLEDNEIVGDIPEEVINMFNLEILDLSNCQLSGRVPTSYNLALTGIDLSENNLSQDITAFFLNGRNLLAIDLSDNAFTGRIPNGVYQNTDLFFLDLSNNDLEGGISSAIGDLTNLDNLMLAGNQLSGELPSTIGSLRMNIIALNDNQLTGELPTQTTFYSSCANFNIADNNFEGELPPALGNVPSAFLGSIINVANNNFTGTIPQGISGIQKLRALDVSGNQLSGSLSASFFNSMQELRLLGLNDNNFQGAFPELQMPELRAIDFTNNNFTGSFPILSGMPSLRNDSWTGISVTGASNRFYNFTVSLESRFCGGNDFIGTPDFSLNEDLDIEDLDLSCFGVASDDIETEVISVFPNPASDFIVIETESENQTSFQLLDLSGKALMPFTSSRIIQVDFLTPGMYLLKVESLKGVTFRKIHIL